MAPSGPDGGAARPLTRRTISLAVAGIVVVYLAVRLPLLDVPLDRDEGIFGWMGQSILRGELPYRDVFDHKPPGVFYLYALAVLLVPPTAAGVHGFLLVWNAATLAAVAGLTRTLAGTRAALWAGLAFALLSAAPSVQGFTASAEMLLLLPLTAGVWCAVVASRREGRRRVLLLVASGVLAAGACWIKQSAAVALLVAPGIAFFGASGGIVARVRALGWWLAGGVALSVLVVAPFASAGTWSAFWYWSFTHSALYSEWSMNAVLGADWRAGAAEGFADLFRDGGALLVAGIVGTAVLRRGHRTVQAVAFAFLAGSLVSVLHSAFLYPHYFAQAVPAIALVAGIGLARLAALRGAPTLVAALVLVLGAPLTTRHEHWIAPDPVRVSLNTLGPQAFEAGPLLAEFARETTQPDDSILVVGSEPQIPFMAARRSTNPYGMTYPLTGPFPRQREFQDHLLERIAGDPPALVFFVLRIEASLLVTSKTDPRFLTEIERRVRSDYKLVALLLRDNRTGRWRLDRLTSGTHAIGIETEAYVTVWRRKALR